MDEQTMQFLKDWAENLSVIAVLLYAWIREAKRADALQAELITSLKINRADSRHEEQ